MQLAPLFPRPLFRLIPDQAARPYANVSNELGIYYRGRDSVALVQVPAELFSVMRYLRIPRGSAVSLYLDQINEDERAPRFAFGLVYTDKADRERIIDLWEYGGGEVLPGFLTGRW